MAGLPMLWWTIGYGSICRFAGINFEVRSMFVESIQHFNISEHVYIYIFVPTNTQRTSRIDENALTCAEK
jgi:hypothetical protein